MQAFQSLITGGYATNIPAVLKHLKAERKIYWQEPLAAHCIHKAVEMGKDAIEQQVNIRIRKVIGIDAPYRDGITPLSGSIVFHAQHATATCCRSCMEHWHNIPKHRKLSEKELLYSIELILSYIRKEIPQLYA